MRLSAITLPLLVASCAAPIVRSYAPDHAGVEATLDAFHEAASRADGDAYFALFTEDAVFLGTDATERWDVAAFQAYARPFFDAGRGWTYTATERHVSFGATGRTAWFDERLQNEKYGEVRGSGVLERRPDGHGGWRIAQYNLAFPVPNELATDLVERVRALD